jgi:Ca2+-binding RTX toxin-like protein
VAFIGSGDFTATANAAGQRLTGATGADSLSDGGYANSRLVGAGGNDTYSVSNATTVITEAAGGGSDTVKTSLASYTLPGNVDNLTFTGTGAFTGTGNALANVITGGPANDVLTANGGNDRVIGGAGADRMSGNGGADTFVFAPVNPTTANGVYVAGFGHDVLTDFVANAANISHDNLLLSSSMFAPGTTAAALLGGTAQNAAGTVVAVVQSGANVVITVDPTDTITLNNVSLATLRAGAAADIHFS